MRETGLRGLHIKCDHCGEDCGFAEFVDGGPAFLSAPVVAQEVWFNPPGGRGGIRYEDRLGDWCEKRVTLYDSCTRCAATMMEIVEMFYEKEEADGWF